MDTPCRQFAGPTCVKGSEKNTFRICTDEAIVEWQTRQDRGKHLFRPRSRTSLFAFSRVFIKQGEGGILSEEEPPSDPPSTFPRSSSLTRLVLWNAHPFFSEVVN